jgi:hypothetical protein
VEREVGFGGGGCAMRRKSDCVWAVGQGDQSTQESGLEDNYLARCLAIFVFEGTGAAALS